MTCPRCYSIHSTVKVGPFGPHVAKLICFDCGRFIKWLSKDEMKKVRERERS